MQRFLDSVVVGIFILFQILGIVVIFCIASVGFLTICGGLAHFLPAHHSSTSASEHATQITTKANSVGSSSTPETSDASLIVRGDPQHSAQPDVHDASQQHIKADGASSSPDNSPQPPPPASPSQGENSENQTTVAASSWLMRYTENCEHTAGGLKALQLMFFGIELLLFAPLCFLVLRSLAGYVSGLCFKGMPYARQKEILQKIANPDGKEGILETKALIIALLFGMVATHLVSEMLRHKECAPFTLQDNLASFVLLALLAIVYLMIEWIGLKTKRLQHETTEGALATASEHQALPDIETEEPPA